MPHIVAQILEKHPGTVRGLAGTAVGLVTSHIIPILTVIVLLLTIVNLCFEIRKNRRKP